MYVKSILEDSHLRIFTELNLHNYGTRLSLIITHINIDMVTESDTKVKNALISYFLLTYDRN